MKILHTSDWHLGTVLHGRRRYDEYEQFLDWLAGCIRDTQIDVLLISGDIFDNTAPSNRAQELYYHFLNQVAEIQGLQVIITGGNHDSPSLLDAPKPLLRQLRIHVIGAVTPEISEEVILLRSANESECLIVCAVPYLRDRDIRTVEPGESIEDKMVKIQEGISEHYRQVWAVAQSLRGDSAIPIIAMGHLFLSGCPVHGDERVRELYIGNLRGIDPGGILCGFDYLALGHLHEHRKIEGNPWCRYSGAPIPLGFGEAGQEKKVIVIDFPKKGERSIREIPVPCFRKLQKIQGDISSTEQTLRELCEGGERVWVEVVVESEFTAASLQARLHDLVRNSPVEILKIENAALTNAVLRAMVEGEHLADLDETDVFSRCLDEHRITGEDRDHLLTLFQEILVAVREEDRYDE
ncbi:MAG: exonuclease SbcCD subunit D C-terminal domain-containing protein [Methanoregulaceae archaeon]|nr:exonuclease SbcCD subunit D C-terminal domain-containing protein [Methanoregulaceae archaeon]